ncbi:MAG: phosphatidylserine/phosphatidylglycerophosphate/cardiolipin synthase family protein [Myxococcales bacterium]|nr:phosphatidylserine/phosphatidylglycerophosphate/cardiolipin synthase family protein [Myxococcales bacterium]
MKKPLIALFAALAPVACAPESPAPAPFTGALDPAHGELAYRSLFRTLTATPDGESDRAYAALRDEVVALVDGAEDRLEVMVENLDSEIVADAIVDAAARGVAVRVVGDIDRRDQKGFARLEEAGIAPVYGDGEITWSGVFGEDPILRTGEDNRLTHNVFIADRQRVVSLSAGFPEDGADLAQQGFAAISEVIARDFGNAFDQLHGGVFATTLTYYDQGVPSDTNNRTAYPVEDGIIELWFGPQEPIVKEIIDRVYDAKSAVWVATPELRNSELARALRYKAESGFSVRVLVGARVDARDEAAALEDDLASVAARRGDAVMYRVNPAVGGTLLIIDGQPLFSGDRHWPGFAMVSTTPLFEAVPYYIADVLQDGLDLAAQPSDRFIDGHLWGVREGDANKSADYLALRAQYEALYAAGEE